MSHKSLNEERRGMKVDLPSIMTAIPDERLHAYADRVKGKVVVITGAANGIGRETAKLFATNGSKIVIGDRDIEGANKTAAEIIAAGGEAVATSCDVTIWEDVVSLYELAISKFGVIDIVVPNAGISEIGMFGKVIFKDGRPIKPNTATLQVNLIGALYTAHLGLHYLKLDSNQEGSLKALVFIGSMASWMGIPGASMYTASKHALLGVMRSVYLDCKRAGVRVAVIHPFFADTAIVTTTAKIALAGIPKTTVERIAGAIFYAATDVDEGSSGSAWLLPDDGPVFQVPKEEFKLGVYGMIDARANAILKGIDGVAFYARLGRDLWGVFGKKLVVLGIGITIGSIAWKNRSVFA